LLLAATLITPAPAFATHRRRSQPPISFQWVGDIAMSSDRGLPAGGFLGAISGVRARLGDADFTLGNLEGTLSSGGTSKCARIGPTNCFAFQAPAWIAGQLHAAGFDLVNQANNHSLDYGDSGRSQTLSALRSGHVAWTGLPGQITYLWRKHVRVAFLGFAPYTYDSNLLNIPGAQAMVRRARAHAKLVVVIIHAGAEGIAALHTPYGSESYLGENRGDPRAFAHAMIQAGASIVLGSGPHVVRGVEDYRGRLIAYSLGNFVGYHTLAGGGLLDESGILNVTLGTRGCVLAARWVSVHLSDGLPQPERTGASAALVARLSSEDFPRHFTIGSGGRFRISQRR
jgi:hypothetical protein